jgi:hypothetical protein
MTGPKALTQYQQVRAKIDGGMSVAAAVQAVAAETGASRGTLQSVYYRVARENGTTKPRKSAKRAAPSPARGRRGGSTATRGRPTSTASTAELLRQLAETATALSTRIEQLERDSARLREVEAAFAHRR